MKLSLLKIASLAVLFSSLSVTGVQAEDKLSMSQLLQKVKQGRAADSQENKRREQEFLAQKADQERLLQQARAQIAALEAKSAQMEKQFNENELVVNEKRQQRDERLGSLKELFGHLTASTGELRTRLETSVTATQYPGRTDFLTDLIKKMNSSTELPTMEEIEQTWFEIHRELTESGNVAKYNAKVGTENKEIVRIGAFNLVSDGDYLSFDKTLSVLPRQPAGFSSGASDLMSATSGYTPVGIDPTGPTGGQFMKAIIDTPTWAERWHDGKLVGYVITAVGVFAVLLALWRLVVLSGIAAKVKRQLKTDKLSNDNPLGRVLAVSGDNPDADTETLELKLGEAIIKERGEINKALPLLKIISMVAPLLGLLGTVTGMIIVFQAIKIFGAGDPSTMAGGISAALVTTVLGLCVAIPTILLHTWLSGKARGIMYVLEEQSAGILAERSESSQS